MLKYINQEEYKKLLGTENVPNNFNKLVISEELIKIIFQSK